MGNFNNSTFLSKKNSIEKKDFIILSILFIINNFILLNQLNFEILELTESQSILNIIIILFYFTCNIDVSVF